LRIDLDPSDTGSGGLSNDLRGDGGVKKHSMLVEDSSHGNRKKLI
jgi:hypothetical protein